MNEIRKKRMIQLVNEGRVELGKSSRRIMGRDLEYEALEMIEELLHEVDNMPNDIAINRLKIAAKDLMQEFKDLQTGDHKNCAKLLRLYGEHGPDDSHPCHVPVFDRGQKTHDDCTCGLTKIIKEMEK